MRWYVIIHHSNYITLIILFRMDGTVNILKSDKKLKTVRILFPIRFMCFLYNIDYPPPVQVVKYQTCFEKINPHRQ